MFGLEPHRALTALGAADYKQASRRELVEEEVETLARRTGTVPVGSSAHRGGPLRASVRFDGHAASYSAGRPSVRPTRAIGSAGSQQTIFIDKQSLI